MSMKTRGHHHAGHPDTSDGPAGKPASCSQNVSAEQQSALIQIRAYGMWEKAGKPDGDANRERFWCAAEKDVMESHARDD